MPTIASFGNTPSRSFGQRGGKKRPVVTGGTLTADATYYYRTFTASGDLVVENGEVPMTITALGGGGAGHGGICCSNYGAGGAGGVSRTSNHDVSIGTYVVTVGAGGAGAAAVTGTAGATSSVGSLVAATGGGAGPRSGGKGGSNADYSGATTGGTYQGAGAGAGGNGSGGTGGPGVLHMDGVRRGGGGGATQNHSGRGTGQDGGGAGRGGSYSGPYDPPYDDGEVNKGAGGGGGRADQIINGGSGIVIVRYLKSAVD